jgi:antitoxin (DNA-binding transcriptional repressor) of toxin-antitoxin stability system
VSLTLAYYIATKYSNPKIQHLTNNFFQRTIYYNMVQKIDVSEARKNLSSLIKDAYFEGNQFILMRHGIPMAAIVSMDYLKETPRITEKNKIKTTDIELYGIWKKKKKSTTGIADKLRKKAWDSHVS